MKLNSVLALAALLSAPPLMAQASAAGRSPASNPAAQAPASGAPPAAAAPAAPVDPAKAAVVRQLMNVTGSGKLGEEYVDLITERVRQVVSPAIPDPQRLQQFMDAFTKNFSTRITAAQVNDAQIPIYASHLSTEDLQALLNFYQTAAGQRILKALPQIVQESQSAAANMVQPAAMDTLRQMGSQYPEINPILQEQGAAHPPAPAPAAPPAPAPAPQAPPK
jgi:Uncharacterized protein conserved in bacteria (DUF2059)